MAKKIVLEECNCSVGECLYNIDWNCTRHMDNISPNFMYFHNGIECPSKVVCEENK